MVKKTTFLSIFIFVLFSISTQSQSKFNFFGANEKVQTVRFQLINNLIIIPVEVNGKFLSFILDTGVDKTILFNLSQNEITGLNEVKKITLQGLGGGEAVEALLSTKNTIRIGNYASTDQDIYVILKDKFDISSKMGVTIHGIIGYKVLKDAIVKINYRSKKVSFYNPTFFNYRKCRRCEVFSLEFHRNKPYVDAKIQLDTIGNQMTDVKLLIDSGGSDALWLFENTKEEIKTPKKFFKDILGEGLSGTIYGNRSRIQKFSLGKFTIKKPTVSFLDSTSTFYARQFKERNGSIGSNILKRFKVWIDYPNKKMTLKKNGSFRGGFEYNMSGIDVVYNGKVLVREKVSTKLFDSNAENSNSATNANAISLISSYAYRFKPAYAIKHVLEGSPGAKAGLEVGDIIIKMNGAYTYQLTLKEIMAKLQYKHNKKIRMAIERKGVPMKFEFRLVKKI